ncbi:MAG: hypothetical protein KAX16_02530 [Actinomycetia bacterium]|nr:hypothetical protein [Actinomycetes bacterium]
MTENRASEGRVKRLAYRDHVIGVLTEIAFTLFIFALGLFFILLFSWLIK